jgi:hypothetical protein
MVGCAEEPAEDEDDAEANAEAAELGDMLLTTIDAMLDAENGGGGQVDDDTGVEPVDDDDDDDVVVEAATEVLLPPAVVLEL